MLWYEWRPGNPIGDEDAYVVPNPQELLNPEPVPLDLPDPGPNPFVNIPDAALHLDSHQGVGTMQQEKTVPQRRRHRVTYQYSFESE